jgi:hypothetical protein
MNRKFEAGLGLEGEPAGDSSRRRGVERVGRAFVEKQVVSHHGKVVDLHGCFAGLNCERNLALLSMRGRSALPAHRPKVAIGEASNDEQRQQS